MLELDLQLTAQAALATCRERGAVITSERELAGRPGSRHWHLRIPGRPGTLELNECEGRVWVKVHPLREGDWAVGLAHELAGAQLARLVERSPVPVMFRRASDEQASITEA